MIGVNIIGYLETHEEKFLKSVLAIKKAIFHVCNSIKLNIVVEKYYVFKEPNGITYCFILSQSHFVIHTWPEEHKIFFDIFTCNKKIDEKKYVDLLSREFNGSVKELRKVEYK